MNIVALFDKYGPLGMAVIVLAFLLYMDRQDASKERAEHTVLLIEQMSALRHACDPKAP